MLDFNRFKTRLMGFLLSHGLADADLEASHKKTGFSIWHIDWKGDLNDDFREDVDSLKCALNL